MEINRVGGYVAVGIGLVVIVLLWPPLIVPTAGKEFVPHDPAEAMEARAFHHVWVNERQPKLARLSSAGGRSS
jgi:hypothetical protein